MEEVMMIINNQKMNMLYPSATSGTPRIVSVHCTLYYYHGGLHGITVITCKNKLT